MIPDDGHSDSRQQFLTARFDTRVLATALSQARTSIDVTLDEV
jgi:hypothetical protein